MKDTKSIQALAKDVSSTIPSVLMNGTLGYQKAYIFISSIKILTSLGKLKQSPNQVGQSKYHCVQTMMQTLLKANVARTSAIVAYQGRGIHWNL